MWPHATASPPRCKRRRPVSSRGGVGRRGRGGGGDTKRIAAWTSTRVLQALHTSSDLARTLCAWSALSGMSALHVLRALLAFRVRMPVSLAAGLPRDGLRGVRRCG